MEMEESMNKDRVIRVTIGAIVGSLLSILVFKSMRSEGLCRPCYNDGIRTKIYRIVTPAKWECRECSKKS